MGNVVHAVGFLEGLQERVEVQPAATGDAGGGALGVDGVGAGVGIDGGELCFRFQSGVVSGLPLPEDVVDPAVMEEEDGVEGGGVILIRSVASVLGDGYGNGTYLAHVTLSAVNGVGVEAWDLESTNGEMNVVMWGFQGNDDGVLGVSLTVPFCG